MAGRVGMKGAGLGGSRKGAGRPVKGRRLTLGQEFVGMDGDIQVWTVKEVTRTHIVFEKQDGSTVRLLNG